MLRIVIFYFFVALFLLICVPLSFANAVQFESGDIVSGTNGGKIYHYNAQGNLLDTLQTEYTVNNISTPLCFDSSGNLRISNSVNNTISEFSKNGILSNSTWGDSYKGLPTRCVSDSSGNLYVYTSEIFGDTNLIRKFTPGGVLVKTYEPEYDTVDTGTYFNKGLYSMSLSSDNCTMFYTSVQSVDATKGEIKRFNVCTDRQLPDFAEVPIPSCTDIRMRSNGEVITSCEGSVYRLSNEGSVLQTYTPKDSTTLPPSQVSYSLDLDPDGTHFWAGGNFSGNVYKINFLTGTGSDTAVFTVPTADPVWNTLVGLLAYGSASNPTVPTQTPTPTPLPSISPTPVQSNPTPFLDLPWDYQSTGKSFESIAMNPASWFDHAYPLQNILCCVLNVRIYTGEEIHDYYRSHSGYDYPRPLGSPVLAAGLGYATFEPEAETAGGGNVIKIDHGNGYQTWYEHLSLHNIIVSTKNTKISVQKGQKIGEVGMTGNTNGPHIHFSVFKDINTNGSFADDYPYGLVDPLGWEGKNSDPWTQYGTTEKHGARSYNLFLSRAKLKEAIVTQTAGGNLSLDKKIDISVLPGTLPVDFTFTFEDGPFIADAARGSSVPSFFLNAYNSLGENITQFYKPIRIIYHYSGTDMMNIQENSLALYYLNEATNTWVSLPSVINTANKTVTAETNHFSHFALMGSIKDTGLPVTSILLKGQQGQENSYRSDVTVTVSAKDNATGTGIDTTLYKLDNQEWQKYTGTFTVTSEGAHTLSYLSIDKADNREVIQTKQFFFDKKAPEVEISYDLSKYDFLVRGKDGSSSATSTQRKNAHEALFTTTDAAGNMTRIVFDKELSGRQGTVSIISLQYNSKPVIKFDKNYFFTSVSVDRKNSVKQLDQYFMVKGDKRIYTHYNDTTKKTEIYSKTMGNRYQKEEKPDSILMRLFTESGTLKYSYNYGN